MVYGGLMSMNTQRSALSAALAKQLAAERGAAGLSRAALAKASDVSAETIQRLEKNQREFDTDQIDNLCRALGVNVMDFMLRAHARREAEAKGRQPGQSAAGQA